MTSLSLARGIQFGDLVLTDYPFLTEFGMDYSAGDLVTSVLSSFLQDGDLEISQRRGNMTLTIPLLIEGTDLQQLAQAEATLALEAQKATNTLTIIPGDGFGPPTVFDTFEADVSFQFDDKLEQAAMRRLVLTIRALPFGRSIASVTAAAVTTATSPTMVVVNDCSSTTGWSSSTGTVSSTGGVIKTSITGLTASLSLTQTFSTSGATYLFADYTAAGPGAAAPSLTVTTATGSTAAGYPSRITVLPSGFRRGYWSVGSGLTVLQIQFDVRFAGGGIVSVDQVGTSSGLPPIGTTRQQAQIIKVAGSARTQGGVQVTSPTAALGETLVYTSAESSLTPALSSLRVGGSPTTDTARVSGAYCTLSTSAVYDIALGSLTPGLYSLVALVSSPGSTARTVAWSTSTRVNGVVVGRTLTGSGVTSDSAYRFVPLGTMNLPTNGARVGTTATQRITVNDAGSGSAARLDELYLVNLTTGRLTIVSCGTGTPVAGGPSSTLWLDIASVASRTASVMRGTASDGTDAFYANDNIQVLGLHEFVPPLATIFTVTSGALDSQVTLTHFPRWLGHAAS